MKGVRVALSSGDVFWIDCGPMVAVNALKGDELVWIGNRVVNPAQVAMLTIEEIPSIEVPERIEEVV